SFEKDDDIVDEMPCTENYRFLDSLGEWYREYAPPPGDPNDGICECSEFVATSNPFLAEEGAQNRQTRPRTIGSEPPAPMVRTRSFRAVVRALPPEQRAILRTAQGRRLLNRVKSTFLRDQYFENGRNQPRRKIVLIGRGPAGATVVAELNTELRNNPPPDFTVVAIGLVTHFEHMGNFEAGQENPRLAGAAHLHTHDGINPPTYPRPSP